MPGGKSRLELLQGTLDLIILQTLRWGPRHGYGIAQMIRAGSEDVLRRDRFVVSGAAPARAAGLVRAEWDVSENGQRVRIYRLTAAGHRRLADERSRWEQLSRRHRRPFSPGRRRTRHERATGSERELAEEIEAHLRMAVEERMARGESREAAESAARREFGNPTHVMEVTREQRRGVWLDRLLQDVRYGMRSLRRTPAFTVRRC